MKRTKSTKNTADANQTPTDTAAFSISLFKESRRETYRIETAIDQYLSNFADYDLLFEVAASVLEDIQSLTEKRAQRFAVTLRALLASLRERITRDKQELEKILERKNA